PPVRARGPLPVRRLLPRPGRDAGRWRCSRLQPTSGRHRCRRPRRGPCHLPRGRVRLRRVGHYVGADRDATRGVAMSAPIRAGTFAGIDAVLFDLDGVLTPTAEVHMRAWSRLFTPYLEARGVEPYTDADYFAHIDGRPRYEGVRAMLAARGITLPEGDPSDPPEAETVCGLGNRKNAELTAVLEAE